ncbi:MAG: protein kinase [Nostoc sp.]|uniref:protein kinase domain-containing protein n=1 Tax=Nostoc sp. TaxID=1180 RepID=UPI002FFB1E85
MFPSHILRNRYKIIKLLGSGSFGITYLAEDLDLPDHPLCVVKNLRQRQSPEELQIFINFFNKEAKALYRLGREYSQIPQLFAHFQEEGEFYLVQEYIDGHDLSQEIFSGNKLSEAKVKQLLKEILEVLTIIHNQNIIHRDIKAQNLMRRNSDGKIVLIDFGSVKEISKLTVNPQEVTNISIVIGTSGYMPNEQLNGYPKLSSDVYAVGMLGIYALTGIRPQELPKNPDSFEVIWRDRVSVSPFLANVLDKMVRSNFKERYQTAGEALQALTALSSEPRQLTLPPLSISPPSHFFVGNQRLLIGVGVVVSLLFGIGLLFINFLRQPTPNSEQATLVPKQSLPDAGQLIPQPRLTTPKIPNSGQPTPNSEQPPLDPKQPLPDAGQLTPQPGLTKPKIPVTKQPRTDAEKCPEPVPIVPNTRPNWVDQKNHIKYYGELENGQPNGCGTYIFANGNKYEGKIKEGKYNGIGTFIFQNGNRYVGQFNNNSYEGAGKLIYKNGCQYIGEFKQSRFDGQGTCISQNGVHESGIWRQGKLEAKNQTCCN